MLVTSFSLFCGIYRESGYSNIKHVILSSDGKKTNTNQFKVRCVHGMAKIVCTQQSDVILHHPHQSLTFILFEGISRILMEL